MMKRMKLLSLLILVASALLIGCSAAGSNPRSPDYPCGPREHACSVQPLVCCGENMACGGEPGAGCQAGTCCYAGEDMMLKRLDAGPLGKRGE